MFEEAGSRVVEVLEEDARVSDGAERGGVGGDGSDLGESVYGGELTRILDQQKDAAHLVERGDDAAGDDSQLRRERGDGDEAEV